MVWRRQAIIWANVDSEVWRHVATLGHNDQTLSNMCIIAERYLFIYKHLLNFKVNVFCACVQELSIVITVTADVLATGGAGSSAATINVIHLFIKLFFNF